MPPLLDKIKEWVKGKPAAQVNLIHEHEKRLRAWRALKKVRLTDSKHLVTKKLIEAAHNKEVLTIAYQGGSNPGGLRDISPKRVFRTEESHDYLEAYCHSREKNRIFRVDKITIPAISQIYLEQPATRALNLDLSPEGYVRTFKIPHAKYYVYGLMNHNHEIYIGYTNNLSRRLNEHNTNFGAQATKNKGPWVPCLVETFTTKRSAVRRENYYIKNFDVFLKRTFLIRKAIFENSNLEHCEWAFTITNNRKNETL